MLKNIRPTTVLAAALIVSPMFFATPASAGSKHRTTQVRTRVVTPAKVVTPNRRVVRLTNGDFRLPHGQVVSAKRLVRLRNQSNQNQIYWRLPNGDIVSPNYTVVPVRNTVRLQNGYIRLHNGVILRI